MAIFNFLPLLPSAVAAGEAVPSELGLELEELLAFLDEQADRTKTNTRSTLTNMPENFFILLPLFFFEFWKIYDGYPSLETDIIN
jgi:hypothetical protein